MKKYILLFTLSVINTVTVFSQDSLFLFKKDTLFITYDTAKSNPFVLKEYKKSINHKTKKNIGLTTTYNILDNAEIIRKKEQKDYIKKNPGVGMSGVGSIFFGLHFVHGTVKNKIRNIKEDPTYKIFKKHHLKKDVVTYRDSLAFDTFVFHNLFRRYKWANTSLLFSEKELKNKRVIHFDGSKKSYNKIKEFSKKPIYIYIYWIKKLNMKKHFLTFLMKFL